MLFRVFVCIIQRNFKKQKPSMDVPKAEYKQLKCGVLFVFVSGFFCTAGLRRDEVMGNFWASFWLIAWWGAREVLGLVGEEGSEQELESRK